MIIAIDLDRTCITSDMWLYKLININPDAKFIRRKKPFRLNRNDVNHATFINKCIRLLAPKNYYAVEDANKTINKLYQDNTIVFLSSRPSALKSVLHLTQKNIESAGLKYDAIFLNCSNKDEFCKDFNVDIFIDNSKEQCKQVNQNSNAKTICFNQKFKQNCVADDVYCSNNWNDIYNCCQMLLAESVGKKPYLSQEFIDSVRQNYANTVREYLNNAFDYTSVNSPKKLHQQLKNINSIDHIERD